MFNNFTTDRLTVAELTELRLTKTELFDDLTQEGIEFDFALPQGFINELVVFAISKGSQVGYDLIRSATVWVYPENRPYSKCKEVAELIRDYDNRKPIPFFNSEDASGE